MLTVGLTGGTGFVGTAICNALVGSGHHVLVLSRQSHLPEELRELGVRLVTGDVREDGPSALTARSDVVVHAAGLVRTFDSSRLSETNVDGTRNVTRACAEAGCRLVHVSSAGVHGSPGRVVDERSAMRPRNEYETSKVGAEKVIAEILPEALVVRPTVVIGPGHPHDPLLRFLRAVMRGRMVVSRRGWTNYVGARSVGSAIAAAIAEPDVPTPLLLNDPLPLTELAALAASATDSSHAVAVLPRVLERTAAPLARVAAAMVPAADRVSSLFDATRIESVHGAWLRDVGIDLSVAPTIVDLADWYRGRGLL